MGYPLSPTRSDGVAIEGYCTDGVQTTESTCIAQFFCTVAGSCDAPATAATEDECGTCSTVSSPTPQPTATDRFTQTECVKDSDGDGAADGTWSPGTWSTSDATESSCASVLGGEWKARTWVPAPLGDATTGWRSRRPELLWLRVATRGKLERSQQVTSLPPLPMLPAIELRWTLRHHRCAEQGVVTALFAVPTTLPRSMEIVRYSGRHSPAR